MSENRFRNNNKVHEEVGKAITAFPDLRYCQILRNLDIINEKDNFYEEPDETYNKVVMSEIELGWHKTLNREDNGFPIKQTRDILLRDSSVWQIGDTEENNTITKKNGWDINVYDGFNINMVEMFNGRQYFVMDDRYYNKDFTLYTEVSGKNIFLNNSQICSITPVNLVVAKHEEKDKFYYFFINKNDRVITDVDDEEVTKKAIIVFLDSNRNADYVERMHY